MLESIIDLLDAGIVNQSSLSHIFSSSWVNNLRSDDPWFKNIKVEIEEYQPLAYWHGDSFLTQSGLIITPSNPSIDLDLIILEGEESYKYNLIDFSRKLQSLLIRINNNLHSLSLKNGYLKAITAEGLVIFFDFKEFLILCMSLLFVDIASEPPLKITLLPDFKHRPAASIVTFGRDS